MTDGAWNRPALLIQLGALSALLAVVAAPAIVIADVPSTLHHQGVLIGADDLPIDGDTQITFRLYDTSKPAPQLWRETQTVTVVEGLYSVELGSSQPFPAGLFEDPLYLGIEIESDGELEPRLHIVSNAFALRAGESDTLAGMTASDLDQSDHLEDTDNPHEVSLADLGAASVVGLDGHANDEEAHHASYFREGQVMFTVGGVEPIYAEAKVSVMNDIGVRVEPDDIEAALHIRNPGAVVQPSLFLEGASASDGDIAWDLGETLQVGTWDQAADTFDEKMHISSGGNVHFTDTLTFAETTQDKISLFGNRLGQVDMYGFGVGEGALYYRTNGIHAWMIKQPFDGGRPNMVLTGVGLGIGTPTPDHELIVQGNDPAVQIRDDFLDNSANAARLELLERAGGNFDGGAYLWWNGETDRLLIGTKQSGDNTNLLVIDRATQSVGIGTQSFTGYKLAVNGSIRAKEVIVETAWADYVFDDDYELAPLPEVKAYIDEHGHLPDIPTAVEVAEKGVALGEMDSRLLRKVEELTLHLIEMNERLDALEGENARLRAQAARDDEARIATSSDRPTGEQGARR